MADRLAIVTGTSSGIGEALAQRLLDEGWLVFGVARREVSFAGGNYRHVQADLADPNLAGQLESRIQAELAFRSIDRVALINNAATPGQRRSYGRQDAGTTFQNIATNLAAPMALMDMVLRLRPEGTALRVINLSSGLAYRPLEGAADYCASKAGLHMAGEVCALESQDEDTAVLSYSPGIVDTEMQQALRGERAEDFPSVDVFRAMHEESRLAAAEQVLEPIMRFLQDAEIRGFHEARFDPETDA